MLAKTATGILATMVLLAFGVVGAAGQVVPGLTVEHYADVTDPLGLTFAPDGTLYSGRDNAGSGGETWDAVKIHQIGIGGTPVVEYGNDPIPDPDSVLFDAAGLYAQPGSVLVAGQEIGSLTGFIRAVQPDQTIVDLWGPSEPLFNPNAMLFDNNGRLLVSDDIGDVYEFVGGDLSLLIDLPAYGGASVVDEMNRIYTRTTDGIVRVFAEDGTLIDDAFATGLATTPLTMEFGPGNSLWGDDLYTLNRETGELLRIDDTGTVNVIGTGFDALDTLHLTFGPDGYMYLSAFGDDRVIRIVPEPASLSLLALGALALLRRR